MNKELFKEYSPSERREMFESNADGIEERSYFEELTEEELIERKSRFAQRSIEAARIEDRKKEVMDDFKAEMEPVKKEQTLLLTEIKTGHTEKYGRVFKMVDREEGMVGYYSESGTLIEQRPATRDERSQLTIASGLRKVVNQ